MQPKIEDDDEIIAGQLTYFNILAQSIMRLNDALTADEDTHKDAKDAADVLLTDFPTKWKKPIMEQINKEEEKYNKIIEQQKTFLQTGVNEKRKEEARYTIFLARKEYAKNLKVIAIDLMMEKDILYQTRKKVEQGGLSLADLGEADDDS